MKFISIFVFTLSEGKRFKIASLSLAQALQTLERLTKHAYTLIHVEIRIRILLSSIFNENSK